MSAYRYKFDAYATKFAMFYTVLMWLFLIIKGDPVFWIWNESIEKTLGFFQHIIVYLSYGILIIGSIGNLGFMISAFKVGWKQAWRDEFGNADDNNY